MSNALESPTGVGLLTELAKGMKSASRKSRPEAPNAVICASVSAAKVPIETDPELESSSAPALVVIGRAEVPSLAKFERVTEPASEWLTSAPTRETPSMIFFITDVLGRL